MAAAVAISGKGLEDGKYKDLDRDHPELERFKRMISMGLPQGAVENAMMRDGILPSSLFDAAVNNPTGAPPAITLNKPAAPVSAVKASGTPSAAAGSEGRPPPGLSLIEEMKWRQANSKQRAVDANGNVVASNPAGGFKIPERKKSVAQPQRMIALKPSEAAVGAAPKADAPKLNSALAPSLKPVKSTPLPGPNPAAKYTAPVYSNLLKPTPKPTDKRPSVVVPSFAKPKPAEAGKPAEARKVEIEFMPGPTQQLLSQKPPEEQINADGSRIVRDKDGSLTQFNPNGTVIRLYQDGSRKQENPDGTIIETNADESKVVQTNPDGTRLEMSGGMSTFCFPDGTIVQNLANGEKHQTNPDGTMIHTYPDGRQVQTSIHNQVEITSYPDGSLDQLDKATGKKLHKNPDGTIQAVS